MECGGLLQGSSAQKIAQHVQGCRERGQEAIEILRKELGEEADTLVPLVQGGIKFSKLRGVMHDTCDSANKVARLVRVQRDTGGKAFFGEGITPATFLLSMPLIGCLKLTLSKSLDPS